MWEASHDGRERNLLRVSMQVRIDSARLFSFSADTALQVTFPVEARITYALLRKRERSNPPADLLSTCY